MIKDINVEKPLVMPASSKEEDKAVQYFMKESKRITSLFIHELRNPLSLIKGTLQYIEMKHPEAKEFKYWSQLFELIQDMENIMSDASLLNSCTTPNKKPANLSSIIHNIVKSYMPQANNQQKQLTIKEDPQCKPILSSYNCDSAKIKQVISNLLKNALEATSLGDSIGVIINQYSIDLVPMIAIQITNNGKPIPEDEIDSLFLPFVTYKKDGTGIGLPFSKHVIESHGGTIQVSSTEEVTCFTILLPI
ncbi:MAG: HAMP domain-containing histidine kinase [Clostridiales bacterium]|nr:HAMP domain-containing histidine kinase [Clostridiales bacterium]